MNDCHVLILLNFVGICFLFLRVQPRRNYLGLCCAETFDPWDFSSLFLYHADIFRTLETTFEHTRKKRKLNSTPKKFAPKKRITKVGIEPSSAMSHRRSRSGSPSGPVRSCTNSQNPRDMERRIFVGNLPTSLMDRKDMEELFSPYGKIHG